MQYIAQLGLDKVFIIAGTAYTDVRDLSGKPVNLGPGDSAGTTSGLVLEALGVEVKPVAIDHRLAIELIKKGELAATVLVGADLRKLFVNVQPSKDLQLLPIAFDEPPAPYVQYVLKGSQLPGLVRSDTNYETVAVPLVLVTNSWQPNNFRYQRVQDFVKAMFAGFAELRQPLHAAEWQDVDLAAELPDWQRFEPAQEALANYQPDSGLVSQMQELFSQFVVTVGTDAAKLNEEDRGKLFDQFLRLLDDTVSTKIVVRLVTSSGVGADAGTLTLSNTKFSVAGRIESGLLIVPDLKGMEPGPYALHVHENPQCGPKLKDGVMVAGLAAGTHLWLSGTGALKGKQFTSHLGDLPDLVVNADQTATGDIVAARLSLADVYNRSIVIHANNDDTSPRLACGMFR